MRAMDLAAHMRQAGSPGVDAAKQVGVHDVC
jgi:hypothetical protein